MGGARKMTRRSKSAVATWVKRKAQQNQNKKEETQSSLLRELLTSTATADGHAEVNCIKTENIEVFSDPSFPCTIKEELKEIIITPDAIKEEVTEINITSDEWFAEINAVDVEMADIESDLSDWYADARNIVGVPKRTYGSVRAALTTNMNCHVTGLPLSTKMPIMTCNLCQVDLWTDSHVLGHLECDNHKARVSGGLDDDFEDTSGKSANQVICSRDKCTKLDHSVDLLEENVRESYQLSTTDCTFGKASPNVQNSMTSSSCQTAFMTEIPDPLLEGSNKITGYRIVSGDALVNFINSLQRHKNFCPASFCDFNEEKQPVGLISRLEWKCRACGNKYEFQTDSKKKKHCINHAMVLSSMSIGIGYTQLNELLTVTGVPNMGLRKYTRLSVELYQLLGKHLKSELKKNAERARNKAISAGHVDGDGIPWIVVVADESWPKKSYGQSLDSLSGIAAIFDYESGYLLDIGIRNSYCYTCTCEDNLGTEAQVHNCLENCCDTAGNMEKDILVQCFKDSEEKYKLRYKYLFADLDSSTFANIVKHAPYAVHKIECTNHLLRTYQKKILGIMDNTAYPVEHRKLLKVGRATKLVFVVRKVIDYNSQQKDNTTSRVLDLQTDIRNASYHVFGDHSNCKAYYCNGNDVGETNFIAGNVSESEMFLQIAACGDHLVAHADSLIQNVNSNVALLCKSVGLKRANFCMETGYSIRILAAACYKIHGPGWQLEVLKDIYPNEESFCLLEQFAARQRKLRDQNRMRSKPGKS